MGCCSIIAPYKDIHLVKDSYCIGYLGNFLYYQNGRCITMDRPSIPYLSFSLLLSAIRTTSVTDQDYPNQTMYAIPYHIRHQIQSSSWSSKKRKIPLRALVIPHAQTPTFATPCTRHTPQLLYRPGISLPSCRRARQPVATNPSDLPTRPSSSG